MTVEKVKCDATFDHELAIVGISPRRIMEAAGVGDIESLEAYMLEHFATKSGYQDIKSFLTKNNIHHKETGYTHYG